MNQLERNLSRVLQEHQHESGLHIIGGQRRLLDRLMQFFEAAQEPSRQAKSEKERQN